MVVDSDLKLSESPMEPVNVIYQTAEDGLGDTIKPRLLVAGADCSRVMTGSNHLLCWISDWRKLLCRQKPVWWF